MRAYKCTVHDVLCTRFHFCNNASVLYVYVLYVGQIYGVQAVYITLCVYKCVHSCTCTLCENSDSVRNKNPKSLQVVLCVCVHMCVCVFIHAHVRFVKTLQVVQAQSLCVCACVCVCTCVYIHAHVRFVKTVWEIRAQSHCKWYKPNLWVCVCMCVCAHACAGP